MLMHFLQELGIDDARLAINTRGVASDRPMAETMLREHFAKHLSGMCPDCNERFNTNLWRILDCKCSECRAVIDQLGDYALKFSPETREYFDRVRRALDTLKIPYVVDSALVRGLDYYVHTVWEVSHPALGGQSAVAGGGRYELTLPGENKPLRGVGFAAGVERLMMILDAKEKNISDGTAPVWSVAPLGGEAVLPVMEFAQLLRAAGHRVYCEVEQRSMKAIMRSAGKSGVSGVFVMGSEELAKGTVQFKNFTDGTQQEIPVGKASELLNQIIL
jgi:histidyl-tRNA synthetase